MPRLPSSDGSAEGAAEDVAVADADGSAFDSEGDDAAGWQPTNRMHARLVNTSAARLGLDVR